MAAHGSACRPATPPATDATIETSSASDGVRSGKMPGRHAASSDLPAPGGPTISRLCPPAAAISSARLAVSCPFTCLRSGPATGGSAFPAAGGAIWPVPFRWLTSANKSGAATTSMRPAHAASGPCAAGQISPRSSSEAWSAASNTPGAGAIRPSRPSSPTATNSLSVSASTTPIAASSASAIGRSKCDPSLGRSAGERLTVIRLGGSARPIAPKAPRTRSRLSATALSARPTTMKLGRPGSNCTCTSTARASSPKNATVDTIATTPPPVCTPCHPSAGGAAVQRLHPSYPRPTLET